MEAKFDMSGKILEQMVCDQQILAKQMEATSQGVAQLTQKQIEEKQEITLSPTSCEEDAIAQVEQDVLKALLACKDPVHEMFPEMRDQDVVWDVELLQGQWGEGPNAEQ